MNNLVITVILSCIFITATNGMARKEKFIMDESYVCTVKMSCIQCLKLPHCAWCPTNSRCFSKKLTDSKEYCSNNTIEHQDYGLSYEENAECSCSLDEVEQRCYPPGVTSGPECSGRGTCVCGQCVCNSVPDPEEPTKTIMGEFCEFDNFSCEGPKCNEGPYSINDPNIAEDGSIKTAEVDIPIS